LINFELPWNPAKKNQRIGRIDRLGQKSKNLTIINFITRNSIETQIASGLLVKQSLFDGVLGDDAATNFVDFSSKGRSQFIEQLEVFIRESENQTAEDDFEPIETEASSDVDSSEEADLEQIQETKPVSQRTETAEIDLSEDSHEDNLPPETTQAQQPQAAPGTKTKAEELEEVMNNGLQFLSGLFRMSTGKELGSENQKIEIDKETGEVVMRFKLPV